MSFRQVYMNKRAGLDFLSGLAGTAIDAATLLAIAKLTLMAGAGFGTGYGLAKVTAARKTDLKNLEKSTRLARLNNDITDQQNELSSEMQFAADKPNKKKTVYGIV